MKVIIVGGLAKRRNFPTDLDDAEVWCINRRLPWLPRVDRMFNLHTYDNLCRYRWPHFQEEVEWSAANPHVPFYTTSLWQYPHEMGANRLFPGHQMMADMLHGEYHCSSADWLVAFVMYMNEQPILWHADTVTEIHLHGIDLNMAAGQPVSARACLEYWCGRAEGEGIGIVLAKDAHLFEFFHVVRSKLVYGYNDTPVVEDCTAEDIGHRLASKTVPYDYDE